MCMCVTLLCGEVTPTPSDSQASASALVALPVSVLDYDHHSLALYCRYCGSASAGLVLRIKPVGVVLLSIMCFLETARSVQLNCLDPYRISMVLARMFYVHMLFPPSLFCLRHSRAALFG